MVTGKYIIIKIISKRGMGSTVKKNQVKKKPN